MGINFPYFRYPNYKSHSQKLHRPLADNRSSGTETQGRSSVAGHDFKHGQERTSLSRSSVLVMYSQINVLHIILYRLYNIIVIY